MPALSVILPTVGRDTLERALGSCRSQLEPDDRVHVVGDSHQPGLLEGVQRRVWEFGPQVLYWEHDGGFQHWGAPQRNFGIEVAKEGSLLVFQDDTDEFAPGAFEAVRDAHAVHGDVPMLFEVDLRNAGDYLDCNRAIRCGEVDGHQLVVPNVPGRVADWPYDRYESDFDWIERTLGLWPLLEGGESFVRVPFCLSICHPKP